LFSVGKGNENVGDETMIALFKGIEAIPHLSTLSLDLGRFSLSNNLISSFL